ncbi:MAG: alcohol dehydrogenase catalytic domain-containing protein [Phycisphaerae bacterium]|jgi:L-iditol 2-dehydrogenase
MLAAFKCGKNVRLAEAKCPAPQAGQIRLQVLACGVCGTDLHQSAEANPEESMFGHEIVGRILELGAGMTSLKVGQVVALDSSTPCGWCDRCRDTQQELCTDIQSFFFIGSFGFAQEMTAPAISALPCDDMDPAVATVQEPLGVALDLVRLADLTVGSNVLIMGQGPIGLMALALARKAGARRVYVSDFKSRTGRLKLAKAWGADDYIDPSEGPLDEFKFDGPIDRILVTSPPKTLAGAFNVACKGAIVSFIGIEHGSGAFCTFDANAFHFKKLQLRASFASPALFGAKAMKYLREGVIDGAALVSHRFGLNDMAKALEVAGSDPTAIKVVVEPARK